MNDKVFIYALCDNSGIRYIGKSNNVDERFKYHYWEAFSLKSKSYNTYKARWFRKYVDQIYYKIIEECSENNWENREIFWINYYKNKVKLVNTADGGKGGNNNCGLSINQYTLEGIFVQNYISIRKAGRITNIYNTNINKCAKGDGRSTGGYLWKYLKDVNNFENISPIRDKIIFGSKIIIQLTLDNKFVKEWNSLREAGNYYNRSKCSIQGCIKGRQKTCAGYKWKYKENLNVNKNIIYKYE